MLNVERLALVHPPWFDDEGNELGASYFASQDVTVIMSASADLANDPSRIETEALVEWVTRNVPDNAEAISFGGNGFLAAGAIDRLETTRRAVLESNQVLLWSILSTGHRVEPAHRHRPVSDLAERHHAGPPVRTRRGRSCAG